MAVGAATFEEVVVELVVGGESGRVGGCGSGSCSVAQAELVSEIVAAAESVENEVLQQIQLLRKLMAVEVLEAGILEALEADGSWW